MRGWGGVGATTGGPCAAPGSLVGLWLATAALSRHALAAAATAIAAGLCERSVPCRRRAAAATITCRISKRPGRIAHTLEPAHDVRAGGNIRLAGLDRRHQGLCAATSRRASRYAAGGQSCAAGDRRACCHTCGTEGGTRTKVANAAAADARSSDNSGDKGRNLVDQCQQNHTDDEHHGHFLKVDSCAHARVIVIQEGLAYANKKHHRHELRGDAKHGLVVVDRYIGSPARSAKPQKKDAGISEHPSGRQEKKHVDADEGKHD